MRARLGIPFAWLVPFVSWVALGALAPAARAADPTAQELHFLYEVNRARHDPPAWAAEYGLGAQTGGDGQPVTLVGVEPRPPVALNTTLVDSSRFKAQEMATNNYFAHMSAVDGRFANDVVRAFGYPLPAQFPAPGGGSYLFPANANGIESISAGYGPGQNDQTQAVNAVIGLIVDGGIPSLGHRNHLLAIDDYNTIFAEAGAGYGVNANATYKNYWAFHTGVRATVETYVNGVVYADGNANSRFDPGEGIAGVTVQVGANAAVTGPTGGYSIQLGAGTYAVACSGGGFAGAASGQVTLIGFNREVDCISGDPAAWVDFVRAPEPAATALAAVALGALAALQRRRGR